MDDNGLRIFQLLVELAGIHQLSELLSNFHGLEQGVKNTLSVIGFFTVIFGILQCFLGYKLFKFWCGLIGLLVGSALGLFITATGLFSGSLIANLIGLLVIVLLALIGTFVAFRLYLVGLFIYAFTAAFIFGFFLLAIITDSTIAGLYAGIIGGLALGTVAVIYHRFWIILTTSISGGMTIGTSLVIVLQSSDSPWVFILPPLFMVAGFIIQTQTVKKAPAGGVSQHEVHVIVPPPESSQAMQASANPQYPGVESQYPETQQQGYPQAPHQADPDAPTAPLPQSADMAAVPIYYSCPNCDYTAINNTAPCSNCGGAVSVRNSLQ